MLQHGEVAEQGTHQELVERGGLYSRLWLRQVEATSTADGPSRTASPQRSKPDQQDEAQQQPSHGRPAQRRVAPQGQDDYDHSRGHGHGHGHH